MRVKINDVTFDRSGQPGIVSQKNEGTGEFIVSKEKAQLREQHRHGYINGLNPQDRTSYLSIIDNIKNIKEPQEKVQQLNEKISELRQDPSQHRLVGYLEAELFHTMNTFKIHPKTYTMLT